MTADLAVGGPGPAGALDRPLPMVVGPTRLAPSVCAALARQPLPLTDAEAHRTLAGALRDLRSLLGAPADATAVIQPGTGTMGMESLVASVLPPGTRVVVASTGMWGQRWAEICRRLGHPTTALTAGPGRTWDLGVLDGVLAARRGAALLVTHVDSSSAVRADLARLAALAHGHGAVLLVDGISAAGAETVEQEAWQVDAYLASSPKALAAPAGLSACTLLPGLADRLAHRSWTPPTYALDLAPWVPVMTAAEQGRFDYFQTPAVNLLAGLAEALRLARDEGRAARVERHRRCRDRLHAGLARLGIRLLVEDPAARAYGMTTCWHPAGGRGDLLARAAAAGVLLQTGTHPVVASRTFRIGHLGTVTEADVDRTLEVLARVLPAGRPVAVSRPPAAAMPAPEPVRSGP